MIEYLKKTSLTYRIISGLILGLMTGLFFGEEAAPLHVPADVRIGLLQMTILPREVSHLSEFFEQPGEEIDALMIQTETGTAWTLLHPQYSAVNIESSKLNIPAGFAVPRSHHDFAAFLGRWLSAKNSTGDLQIAYDYWILGKGAEKREPRWSIAKDVLGWIDE